MKPIYRFLFLAAMASTSSLASAQDVYDAQTFINSDLNGTARFVSMGGALGALGGDISVMSTNPAGTALYRKSDAAITASGLITSNKGAMGHDATRLSIDQAGFVLAMDMGNPSNKGLQNINLGVNVQKNRNFFENLSFGVQNTNGLYSQTYQIADMANQGMWNSLNETPYPGYDSHFGTIEYLADRGCILADMVDENGDKVYYTIDSNGDCPLYDGVGADNAYYSRFSYGRNLQYDVNLSFNVSDRFFYGLSIGVYDIRHDRESFYSEQGIDGGVYDINSWYKNDAAGSDVKLGFICRPFEDSPFRFGINVHSPIWFKMTETTGGSIYDNNNIRIDCRDVDTEPYEYRFRTPWTFGLSLGHTFYDFIALGLEYEYKDCGSARYDEVDYNYGASSLMNEVNDFTRDMMKGQHTLKVGFEVKPTNFMSVRVGYNHVTSPFGKDAYRPFYNAGYYTDTSYANMGAIDRISLGLGFRFKGGYFDLAYQYQQREGDFYAFYDNGGVVNGENALKPTKINDNRTQLMATLVFRF